MLITLAKSLGVSYHCAYYVWSLRLEGQSSPELEALIIAAMGN